MIWLNAALFQLTWFACVLGGSIWGGAALAVLAVTVLKAEHIKIDLALVALLAGVGWLLDSTWIVIGALDYGTPTAPLWIVMLWIGVALTLNHSLSVFHARPALGAVLAGFAAPMSYFAGSRLDRVELGEPWLLVAVMAAWTALFYGLFRWLGTTRERELTAALPRPSIEGGAR